MQSGYWLRLGAKARWTRLRAGKYLCHLVYIGNFYALSTRYTFSCLQCNFASRVLILNEDFCVSFRANVLGEDLEGNIVFKSWVELFRESVTLGRAILLLSVHTLSLLLLLFTLLEFFTLVLADGFSLEFEWQQVSSSLQDSSQDSGRSQQCCHLDSLYPSANFQVLQAI